MDNCLFCKIVNRELPSNVIYEDEHSLSFLDIAPANKGHALVVSKNHFTNILDIEQSELSQLMVAVQNVSKAVQKATKADGINLIQSSNSAAGQVVFHIHFHVIPRYLNDGFKLQWPHKKYEHNESIDFAENIKKFF